MLLAIHVMCPASRNGAPFHAGPVQRVTAHLALYRKGITLIRTAARQAVIWAVACGLCHVVGSAVSDGSPVPEAL